jgi:molybdopterin synthase sulfur carrier subunit
MRILYFAWLREKIGIAEEEVAPPPDISTVGDLIGWLRARGENYEAAFLRPEVVRAAVNQVHVKHDRHIVAGDEIALFPPVTGG